MTIVVTAPDDYTEYTTPSHYSVFLAGAIDMGAAVDWQSYVIAQLTGLDRLALFNPRRAEFTADTLDEQINWELRHFAHANAIFMWFPATAKAPVAMLETGLFMASRRLVLGAETGFYRRRNLEITSAWYGVTMYDNLDRMIEVVKSSLSGGKP